MLFWFKVSSFWYTAILTLTRTPLEYPAVALSHENLVDILQVQSLNTLCQIMDGVDVVMGQLKAMDVNLVGS